jgi:hypothetical protein
VRTRSRCPCATIAVTAPSADPSRDVGEDGVDAVHQLVERFRCVALWTGGLLPDPQRIVCLGQAGFERHRIGPVAPLGETRVHDSIEPGDRRGLPGASTRTRPCLLDRQAAQRFAQRLGLCDATVGQRAIGQVGTVGRAVLRLAVANQHQRRGAAHPAACRRDGDSIPSAVSASRVCSGMPAAVCTHVRPTVMVIALCPRPRPVNDMWVAACCGMYAGRRRCAPTHDLAAIC